MQIPATNTTIQSGAGNKAKKSSGELGKDDFLKLMITELQYQDPLNPMDNKDFIAQTAQFTTLEQMQNMTKYTQLQQATTMVGKDIKATVTEDSGQQGLVYGHVTAVRENSGEFYLTMSDGSSIKATDVTAIYGDQGLLQEALSFKNHNLYIREYNSSGSITGYRQVTVKDVQYQNSQISLTATDGTKFTMEDVWNQVAENGKI